MRRKDREITDRAVIRDIIVHSGICRIGMIAEGMPYIVPLNHGLVEQGNHMTLYFHSAHEGKKLDAIRINPHVCFEMDCGHALVGEGDIGCKYSYAYQSVMGEGVMTFVEDEAEKAAGLAAIMHTQTGRAFSFTPEQAKAVAVLRLDVTKLSAKSND